MSRTTNTAAGLVLGLWMGAAGATISDGVIHIGVLTDMSGGFAEVEGSGAISAVEMAVEDIQDELSAPLIEVSGVDTGGDASTAVSQAGDLLDEGVDVFVGLAGSGVAEAVQEAVGDRAVTIATGAVSDSLTNELCQPTAFHWTPNLYVLTQATREDLVTREGTRNIFIYGEDRERALRTTYEDGVMIGGQDVAGQMFVTDIRNLGNYVASGMVLFTPFYWDADPRSREWSERFQARRATPPTYVQAAAYSATTHYLRAAIEGDSDDPAEVASRMRSMPVDDVYARNAELRADGHLQQDVMLMQVKQASDATAAWDYYDTLATLNANDVYQPPGASECGLTEQ